MPIDFTEDEKAALINLLVGVIEKDRFAPSDGFERLPGNSLKDQAHAAVAARRAGLGR